MGKYLDSTGLSRVFSLIKGRLLPAGGSAGQVLAKSSGTDYAVGWVNQSGGSPTPMTAQEVAAAVDSGWIEAMTVTVSLTNPLYGEEFDACIIGAGNDAAMGADVTIGRIDTPTGSAAVEFDNSTYQYLYISISSNWGASYDASNITCTGGVSHYGFNILSECLFTVTGPGTITIDGIDYGD